MKNLHISFDAHELESAFVAGTPAKEPFILGDGQGIHLPDFFIATT